MDRTYCQVPPIEMRTCGWAHDCVKSGPKFPGDVRLSLSLSYGRAPGGLCPNRRT